MKKRTLSSIALASLLLFSTAWAQPNTNETAQKIIENWFSAMKNHDLDQAGHYLAPQFVSIHTDGLVRNKAGELELIKNLQMKSYDLTDFKFSQSGNIIVVTYKDKGQEMIDKLSINSQAAGRMAVLQKQGKAWLIVAYANLDTLN